MTVMDQDSYWHGYLMARHDFFFYGGDFLLALALICTLTNTCLVRNRGLVSRDEDPKMYWQNVSMYYVLGLISFGLYFYTDN